MKRLLFTPVLLLLGVLAFGQIKIVSQSPVFGDEEQDGAKRLLLMKNGQTALLRLGKNTLAVRIYTAKFAAKATRQLNLHLGKVSSFRIKGVYDMNGDIVMLVSAVDNHQVTCKRVVIDGNTAALKSEEKIGELEKVSYFKLGGVAFGNVPEPDFYSVEMQDGKGYAVLAMNSFQPDRNKRIWMTIYGADNKELSHAYYHSPDDRYKYMEYLGLAPMEGNKLGILAYGYNTASSGGKECQLLYGTLVAGDTLLTIDKYGNSVIPANFSQACYNPVSKKMILIDNVPKQGLASTVIDPYAKKATARIKLSLDRSDIPRNVYANDDGTFSIVYEAYEASYGNNTSYIESGDYTVSVINPEGNEVTMKYTAPRKHYRKIAGNQKMSIAELFSYQSGGGKKYLFLNDDGENIDRIQEGKRLQKVKSLDDCDAFYYTLEGTKEVPAVDYLFGKPAEKREHNLGYFITSDYDAASGMYVVLKEEQRGKDSNFRLVWMKP